MMTVSTKNDLRLTLDERRGQGRTVGLVPTMGALHEGHLSLIEAARREQDVVVLTIFVNPLQFAPTEDLDAYPRPLERDLELAERAGADVVFTPSVTEMYPRPTLSTVHVAELTESMEGASRPTHFDGVTTVVTKLLNLAGPCSAYFGEKDFQQLTVVTRMVDDLDLPVRIVPCPIVREPDGLAMSSRNVYLSPAQRSAAIVVNRALHRGAELVAQGERDPRVVVALVADVIGAEPLAELEYVEIVDPEDLRAPIELRPGRTVRLLAVARFGATRLLDNLGLVVP